MKRARHLAIVIAVATAAANTACFLEIVEGPEDVGEEGGSDETSDAQDAGDPPQTCGNGVREVAEQCEGEDLDGQSCKELGFAGGTLACSPECMFDISGCVQPVCGDGVVDSGEECDGDDFSGRDCESLGFVGGELLCTSECVVDTSGCIEN